MESCTGQMRKETGPGRLMRKAGKKKKVMEHWQAIALWLMLYDVVAVNAAFMLALWVRFDCRYSLIRMFIWEHF